LNGALQAVDGALRLDPDSAGVHYVRGRILAARGDVTGAIAATDRATQIAGTPSTNWRLQRILLAALQPNPDDARSRLQSFLASPNGDAPPAQNLVHLAMIHDALGDRPAALDDFDRAVALRDPNVLWAAVDPRLQRLREEPRFKAAMRQIGLPE
jgi:tetratricopeptide (TPR) repeat protein